MDSKDLGRSPLRGSGQSGSAPSPVPGLGHSATVPNADLLENVRALPAAIGDREIAASIAISLKRIADVLDGTAVGICVTETIFNPQTVQNREVRNNY